MMHTKQQIKENLEAMKADNLARIAALTDAVSVTDYGTLVREVVSGGETVEVWTDAFNRALREHEIVRIPAQDTPYYMDASIIVPSNRRIEAEGGAVIRMMAGVRVLLIRNEHVQDGSHAPMIQGTQDSNISIDGGRWDESRVSRGGYGKSGRYDEGDGFVGCSTCMLFNNVGHVTLTNMTFGSTGGFAVQAGDIRDAVMENITFDGCLADGLHINGNTENLLIRDVRGEVGDDLVALNMCDWPGSSINFGPMRNVLCENLDPYETCYCKAIRILPGTYWYDDGTRVECSVENLIIKNVSGILCFKLYLHTPGYPISEGPSRSEVGKGDNIFFEDIHFDLYKPLDDTPEQLEHDPVRGCFGGIDVNTNIGTLVLENIDVKLYKDKWPNGYLVTVGPKSWHWGDSDIEVFDPYISSTVNKLVLKNVRVNGSYDYDVSDIVHEVVFDDVNGDGRSSGVGHVREIVVEHD